jgi:hypothetical protein
VPSDPRPTLGPARRALPLAVFVVPLLVGLATTAPVDTGAAGDSGLRCVDDTGLPSEVCTPWSLEVQGPCPLPEEIRVETGMCVGTRVGAPVHADGQCCYPIETWRGDPSRNDCGCATGPG